MDGPQVEVVSFDDLDRRVLYDILRLRSAVFVVEQSCVFSDIDGRDTEPETRHLFIAESGEVIAYARFLRDADGTVHLGRFVTDSRHRGRGLARGLIEAALLLSDPPYHLWAQAQLAEWYATFDFEVCGPVVEEDGIPHVPMRRDRSPDGGVGGGPPG